MFCLQFKTYIVPQVSNDYASVSIKFHGRRMIFIRYRAATILALRKLNAITVKLDWSIPDFSFSHVHGQMYNCFRRDWYLLSYRWIRDYTYLIISVIRLQLLSMYVTFRYTFQIDSSAIKRIVVDYTRVLFEKSEDSKNRRETARY